MAKEPQYTDWIRIDGELIHDPDHKIRGKREALEKTDRKDWKTWTEEERARLYDILEVKMKNPRRLITFESVDKQFRMHGYTGLRKVHVELTKQYVKYGDRDSAVKGKSLSEVAKKQRHGAN